MTIRTLWCEAGQHEWEREMQRGRQPVNCPDHKNDEIPVTKTDDNLTPLDKARLAKKQRKNSAWQVLKNQAQDVLDNPKMDPRAFYGPSDGRHATLRRITYIIDVIDNNDDERLPHEIADLEGMLKKILQNPFTSSGHLL
jgi:ribosomal protein L39E